MVSRYGNNCYDNRAFSVMLLRQKTIYRRMFYDAVCTVTAAVTFMRELRNNATASDIPVCNIVGSILLSR